jgi:hypothetical protein
MTTNKKKILSSYTVRKNNMARDGKNLIVHVLHRKIYRYYACKKSDSIFTFCFYQFFALKTQIILTGSRKSRLFIGQECIAI